MNPPLDRHKGIFGFLLLAILFCNVRCSNGESNASPETSEATESTSNDQSLDKGDFILKFDMVDEMSPIYKARLMLNGELKQIVDELNEGLALPHNLPITFTNYGEPNAEYDSRTKSITFGYEFVHMFDSMARIKHPASRVDDVTRNTVIFFLLHELGHAVLDIYKIPRNGNEEEIADNFSAFLVAGGDSLAHSAIDGARFFAALTKSNLETPLKRFAVLDSHPLDAQRYRNILRKIYGSDPARYQWIITGRLLPSNVLAGSEEEFNSMRQAWIRDLGPWSKYR